MKKLIIILITILFTVTLYSQNTLRYELQARGGIKVGMNGTYSGGTFTVNPNSKILDIDSITVDNMTTPTIYKFWKAGTQVDLDAGVNMTYPGAGIPLSVAGTSWGTSITNNSVNWDSAYAARLRWSGTATGLTAATGRTSLGGTTAGQAFFTLANPGAITFPRINANNTVTALSAGDFLTAIGGGAGGYTNLTSFIAQTNWRVFYSNGSGDVTELALGADGTYLKSNGASAAPTFDTPAGAGDMLVADSTGNAPGNYMPRAQVAALVADSLTDRLSGAEVALALADSVGGGSGTYVTGDDFRDGQALKLNTADSTAGSGHYASWDDMTDGLALKATPANVRTIVNDSLNGIYDDERLIFAPTIGVGNAGDTIAFSYGDVIWGVKWNGDYTLVISKVSGVVYGTTPDIDIALLHDANFRDATPTAVLSADLTITSTTTGSESTSFSSATIVPGQWLYIRIDQCTAQPTQAIINIYGHLTR